MSNTDKLMSLMTTLYDLTEDVRVEKIANQIDNDNLWSWCGVWRQSARAVLNELEEELYGKRN